MKMNRTRIFASAALTAFLTGCGGTHSASTVPAVSPGAAQPAAAGLASAVFRIQIPPRTTASTTRAPRYVSPATQSLAVFVTPSGAKPGPAQIFNLTPTSPNCTGAPLTCTITIDAAVGSDTFDFTAYDGTNATGNKLSHSTLTQTIVAGTQNTVNAVMGGIVASFSITAPWTTVFAEGSTATQTYTITAKDASGNTIIGAYDQPVTVTTFDPTTASASAIVTLSANQFTANGDTVKATYSGAAAPQGATLDFTAGTTVLATATIAAFPVSLPTTFTPKTLDGQPGANGPLKVVAWYDAQDLSTMTLGPSHVVMVLRDKSGNVPSRDLTASGNGGPTYSPNGGPGGRSVIDFLSGRCLGPQMSGFPTSSDYTLLVMLQAHPTQAGYANIISGGFNNTGGGHLFWYDNFTNHLTLGRAAGSYPSNIFTATDPNGPPPTSYLAEGGYANAIHMASVSQTLPGTTPVATPDITSGVIEISGSPVAGDIVRATINATTVTYTVTAADVAAATQTAPFASFAAIAAGLANAINAATPLNSIVKASVDTTGNAPGQVFVTLVGSTTPTVFSASPSTGTTTTADATVSDNTSDPTFGLNCYDSHLDSSQDNHIEEAVIYSGQLTAAQRAQLRTYFNRKWAQGYLGAY